MVKGGLRLSDGVDTLCFVLRKEMKLLVECWAADITERDGKGE